MDIRRALATLSGLERVQYIKFYMMMYMPNFYSDDEIHAVLPKLDVLADELAKVKRLQEGAIINRVLRLFF